MAPSITGLGNPKSGYMASNQALVVVQFADLCRMQNEPRPKPKINRDNSKLSDFKAKAAIRLQSQKAKLLSALQSEMNSFDSDLGGLAAERVSLEFDVKLTQMRVLELFRELIEFQLYEEEDRALLHEYTEKHDFIREWMEKKLTNCFQASDLASKANKSTAELRTLTEVNSEKVFAAEPEKADFIYRYFTFNYRKNKGGEQTEPSAEEAQLAREYDPALLDPGRKEWILYFEQNEEWVETLKNRYEAEEHLRTLERQRVTVELESQRIEDRLATVQRSLASLREELERIQRLKYNRVKDLFCSFILHLDVLHVPTPLGEFDRFVVFSRAQLRALAERTHELEVDCGRIAADTRQLRVSKDVLLKNLNLLRLCQKKAKDERRKLQACSAKPLTWIFSSR